MTETKSNQEEDDEEKKRRKKQIEEDEWRKKKKNGQDELDRADYPRQIASMKKYVDEEIDSIEDFDLGDTIGTGSIGRVHVATIRRMRDVYPVAIKIFKKAKIFHQRQIDRTFSEIKMMCKFDSPFIATALGWFADARRIYLILEFCGGGELAGRMDDLGKIDRDEALFVATNVTCALDYLHQRGIAYRDLKPENVLMDITGYHKLVDFGLAKVTKSRSWTLCGTPEYMAPEIILSLGHGAGVDWWALGVLAYEMTAGYAPFFDENPLILFEKVIDCRLYFPKKFNAKIKSFAQDLLVVDRSKRIGCLFNGTKDVMDHKALSAFNWDEIGARTFPAPYLPQLKDMHDVSFFDIYPNSDETAPSLTDEEAKAFKSAVHVEEPVDLEEVVMSQPRVSSSTQLSGRAGLSNANQMALLKASKLYEKELNNANPDGMHMSWCN